MTDFGKQIRGMKINAKRDKQTIGEALHRSGTIHHMKGDLQNAEKDYRQAITIGYINQATYSNLGTICQGSGRMEEAILLFEKAIEINPNYTIAHMNIGNIHKDLGNLDQALASTLKSLELKPDNPTALTNLGGIYKDLGNLDKALASTLKSLELKPDNPDALVNLGGIYQDIGNLNQALDSTRKSLELNPDNPTAHMNLGGIYTDLGNLDQALASTLKSLELKPDNPEAHLNLGSIYKEFGNTNEAIYHLKEANKSEPVRTKALLMLARIYYYSGQYNEGITALHNVEGIEARNHQLSFYLCQNEKTKFNQLANHLIKTRQLNQQGIAAIDHANVLFDQSLDNTLDGSTLDSIFLQTIDEKEFPDALMKEAMIHILCGTLQSRNQGHLENGLQTSGNIFDLPLEAFQTLKELLVKKIANYNKLCHVNVDKDFRDNWEKDIYTLRGWAIVMNKGGNLRSHNHEKGWLTGTFYLQMPEEGASPLEGAIEFSHQGPRYPEGNSSFKKKIIQPSARDLNIFSSSLFHRTLPFQSNKQRICIAFDVIKHTIS